MKSLSDHIMDILQNSISAKATLIEISVEEDKKNDLCFLKIKDNGRGMDENTTRQATNPFFTSRKTRKVGLGLSLLKQKAEMANGTFNLISELGKGTELNAKFQMSNVDRPPLGDIWDTFYLTMLSNKNIEFVYQHKTEKGDFKIHSSEIKEMLGEVSLMQKEIKDAIIELIRNNLSDIETVN